MSASPSAFNLAITEKDGKKQNKQKEFLNPTKTQKRREMKIFTFLFLCLFVVQWFQPLDRSFFWADTRWPWKSLQIKKSDITIVITIVGPM